MWDIGYCLVAWTVACFGIMAVIGRLSRRAHSWRWVNPIYYSMAACGIVLFFLGAERSRDLQDLREQLARTKDNLDAQERGKPLLSYADNFSLLKPSYRLVQGEQELGKSCTLELELRCAPSRQHLQSIVRAFAGYSVPLNVASDSDRIRAVQDFCSRGLNLIDLLIQEGGTSHLIFAEVRENLESLARKNLTLPGYTTVKEARAALEDRLARRKAELLPKTPRADRDDVETIWNENARSAAALHFAFSLCALTPPVSGEEQSPEDWMLKHAESLDEREHIKAAIDQINNDESQSHFERMLARLLGTDWPFLLAFALSLKFGKAIQGLQSKE